MSDLATLVHILTLLNHCAHYINHISMRVVLLEPLYDIRRVN